MKRTINKTEQSYINSLLKKRKEKQMNELLSRKTDRDIIRQYEEDHYVCRNGETSLENQIEKFKYIKK